MPRKVPKRSSADSQQGSQPGCSGLKVKTPTRLKKTSDRGTSEAKQDLSHLYMYVKNVEDPMSVHQAVGGIEIKDFVKKIFAGFDNVMAEYNMLKEEGCPDWAMFEAFKKNKAKNRYTDIKCYDHNRIKLENWDNDYIHANYMDGYKHSRAYIATQGPMPATYNDFWKMIWQEETMVVCMVTKVRELGKEKCGTYWPTKIGKTVSYGAIDVSCRKILEQASYTYTELVVKNSKVEKECQKRPLIHLMYTAWPDCGVPVNSDAFLSYLDVMRKTQKLILAKSNYRQHMLGPPIVIHCSAGIGRTGTLAAVDVCCKKLLDTGRVDVQDTVRKMRTQRFYAVQRPEQYMFIGLTVIQFAISYNLMPITQKDVELNVTKITDEAMLKTDRAPVDENEYGLINFTKKTQQQ